MTDQIRTVDAESGTLEPVGDSLIVELLLLPAKGKGGLVRTDRKGGHGVVHAVGPKADGFAVGDIVLIGCAVTILDTADGPRGLVPAGGILTKIHGVEIGEPEAAPLIQPVGGAAIMPGGIITGES
jgi:hypothetical protein